MRFVQLSVLWFVTIAVVGFYSDSAKAESIEVDVVYPERAVDAGLTLTGSVSAFHNAQLASQQSGIVANIFVEAGDEVKQGELLLSLDDTLAQLQFEQASAELNIAQVALQEAQRLHQELKALSKRQLVAQTLLAERQANISKADAELKNAKAKLALQQELLSRHHIKAPFAGVVTDRMVDMGEWIGTQDKVFSLISNDKLRIELAAPQQYFSQLSQANTIQANTIQANIHNQHNKNAVINSQVERVIASVNKASRTFKVFVTVPENSGFVMGSSAQVTIQLPVAENAQVWLPKSALKRHPDGGYSIFAINNNTADRVFVEVTQQQAERVAVKGASASQQYIKAGVELLQSGAKVSVKSVAGNAL
ncbi:efflux RND transporter periplasmic adaptor subunit [Pseudoalteromonas phenolica]|uniref:Efflux transporter, RND family, MFP subunit n=2 Tax=Pseudoalteromonas phenolica TaxID=161398 RepID=A0A0S2JZW2_9GAMM|nr:efflux RND transporter periplasmic adaptor subunit [Pseudoalteromonas phenolica]ALO41346.1 Efflux transporter, RND family, MFP subunit [Pseudoalteromonas phenolica]MBE0354112.1 hypothetical protein [Pseudoalteromonas phenolica O-BC30]